MQLERIAKLLTFASHKGTSPEEAINAIGRVRAIMEEDGAEFADILGTGVSHDLEVTLFDSMGYEDVRKTATEQVKTIKTLEAEISRLGRVVSQRDETIAKLEQRLSTKLKPDANDTVPYGAFAAEVIQRLGRPKGWQRHFGEHAGYKEHVINHWGITGNVPFDAYQKVATLSPPQRSKMSQPITWTKNLVSIVRANTGKLSESEIAKLIEVEVGHLVTIGQVKRLKINSREGIAPFDDPDFGGPIGVARS